ncbi:MAG: phosphoribosylanthranilate isomerase [Capnocytophaga sp.]|nr:phosphoribosylanthranilate isomerase [Capnocytophaga sp.]
MKSAGNIRAVAGLQPDYMGFIFYEKSARYLTDTIPDIPSEIRKVGVFVNATSLEINKKISDYPLSAIQLHGNETPEFCQELKQNHPSIEIIKAFSVGKSFDFSILAQYGTIVDYFLFDTKGANPGGNGFTFDWQLLQEYPYSIPFFLSGGIGVEHADAIRQLSESGLPLYAIDINSRFETQPGIKNIPLLNEFISKL